MLELFVLFGSPGRTRTSDPAVNSRLLYRLSYRGIPWDACLAQALTDGYIKIDRRGHASLSEVPNSASHRAGRFPLAASPSPCRNPASRVALGIALIIGGTLGFLPILGFRDDSLGFACAFDPSGDRSPSAPPRRSVVGPAQQDENQRTGLILQANQVAQKRRAGFASGPKALGNRGVSSREDKRETALIW